MPEPRPDPVSHQQLFAVEICRGQPSLSRSLFNEGFAVLAVDHIMCDPQAPVTLLDLTGLGQQEILLDILDHHPPDYIHLGMPWGTASRASVPSRTSAIPGHPGLLTPPPKLHTQTF